MNNAVAKTEPVQGEVITAGPMPDATAMMGMLERLARDPSVEVERMEGIMGLFERMDARRADQQFSEALTAAQAEMARIATDANNSQTNSRYATFAAIDRALRPVYTRHGFSLSFGSETSALADHVKVTCKVRHSAGHSELHAIDMPCDGKGARGGDVMTKTHAVGAAMTYGQRYLIKAIFNVAIGLDDDGNSNGGRDLGAGAQAAIAAIKACGKDAAKLALWKRENANATAELSRDDQSAVIQAYNAAVEAAKPAKGARR